MASIHPKVNISGFFRITDRGLLRTLLPRFAELLLVLAIIWVGVDIYDDSREPAKQEDEKVTAMAVESKVDIKALVAAEPFGRPVSQAAPVEVKKTRLTLLLKGTVVVPGKSAALIQSKKGSDQEVYYLGDTILPGVKLAAVESAYVIVDNHGKREKVLLDESTTSTDFSPAPAGRGLRNIRHPKKHGFLGGNRGKNRPGSGKRKNATGNFLNMMSLSALTPSYKDGVLQGLAVKNVVPGSVFESSGLKSGDVITHMNGQQVTNTSQARAIYKDMKNSGGIDIELIRDGQVQAIHGSFTE